jgi:S1-C subfamily serine protease
VYAVTPGSGAAQAGIVGARVDEHNNVYLGDVIVKVAGQPVSSAEDLISVVEQFNLGDQVPLTLHRYVCNMLQQLLM